MRWDVEKSLKHIASTFSQEVKHISSLELAVVPMPLPVLMKRQASNSRSPCPAAAGTTAGIAQQFTLLCGFDLPGDDLVQQAATSLLQCMDICSSYHPRCDAVAYEASEAHGSNNCYLKYAVGTPTTQSFEMDAATAIWPNTQEDCTVNGTVTAAGYEFQTFCGQDYPRDDLVQNFAASLHDCLGLCAGQASCLGVSYEASMEHGYENCYLKSSATAAGLYTQQFVVDSAFRMGPASSSASPSTASSASPPTASSASPSTSTSQSTGSAAHIGATSDSTQHSSKSWIAGAVIGPLVFIVLIAGLVFYIYRRKYLKTRDSGISGVEAKISHSTYQEGQKPVQELDGRAIHSA
jgi:Multi-glycosylated core protein 24 (MGC-24), sialomucin/PAN domain